MWLRHFRHKHRTKRYKAFRDRYYKFNPDDVDDLCRSCHEIITGVNLTLINQFIRQHEMPACRKWTWKQAEQLMQHLRKHYSRWVKKSLAVSS